jgi:hypothetical protein
VKPSGANGDTWRGVLVNDGAGYGADLATARTEPDNLSAYIARRPAEAQLQIFGREDEVERSSSRYVISTRLGKRAHCSLVGNLAGGVFTRRRHDLW